MRTEGEVESASAGGALRRGWRITGRVQGVGFRWWCVRTGVGLGLVGNVRNESDGSVILCAAGSREGLAEMARSLLIGPLTARVSAVEDVDPSGPFPMAGIEVIG